MTLRSSFLFFGLIFMILRAPAASAGEVSLAADRVSAPVAWPELRQARDPWMQQSLDATLSDLGLRRAAARGELSVALVDITEPERPRMAAVNADQAMYAASLPKIAILLGAFHKASEGALELDEHATGALTDMIRVSSNRAATDMLERVGFEYLADLLQSDTYRLYDSQGTGGLWVGKAYARKGAWKRDPVNNLSHAATAHEVARFYYLLETGRLVSARDCATMKSMLAEPGIRHKFVAGLDAHRPGSKVFRKSGTWRSWHSDSAVVERDGRRYIAVALANSQAGGNWLAELIVGLDDIVHHPDNVRRDSRALSAYTTGLEGGVPGPGIARLARVSHIR